MTIEEIYSELAAHMVKGLMIHSQMADYYYFLGLDGYGCCHEYHFLDESRAYRRLSRYFLKHHNKLIPEIPIANPEVISASWYTHVRSDVDSATKKNAVKNGLIKWHEWETETKHLYERIFKELMDIGEVASAMKLKEFICDVDKELEKVTKYKLMKDATGYDLGGIVSEQKSKKEKYKCKMKELFDEHKGH